MSQRILAIRSFAKQLCGTRRQMSYVNAATFKPPSMNDLPVPQGSWAVANAQKQARYNMYLALSILMTTSIAVLGKLAGRLEFYPGPKYRN